MYRKSSATYPLWILKLCLGVMQAINAQTMYESIDLTLAPGQTMLESLQITIPDVVMMTETSMITMIQVSTQMVTQMQTVTETVSGTCAATSPLFVQPSVTQEASSQPIPSSVPLIEISSSTPSSTENVISNSKSTGTANTPSSTVPSPTNSEPSTPSSKPCDCKCLCPASAFPILGPTTVSPIVSQSTFKTLISIVTPGQSVPPLVSSGAASAPNLLAQSTITAESAKSYLTTSITTQPSNPVIAAALTTSRNATWMPASPTPNSRPPNTPLFDINTFSLHSSVSVPLNIRRFVLTGNMRKD